MSYTYSIFVYSILYFNIFACCSFLAFFPLTYEGLKQKTVKGYLICLPLLIKILYCIVIIEFARATFSDSLFQTLQAAYATLDTVVKSTSYQKSYLRLHHDAQEDPGNLAVQDHPAKEFIFNFTNKFFGQDLQTTSSPPDASRLSRVG